MRKTLLSCLPCRLFITVIFCSLISFGISAQEKDFGIWTDIKAEADIVKRLDAEFTIGLKSFQNAGKVEHYYVNGALNYKINDFFGLSFAYRLLSTFESDNEYHQRQKLMADFRAKLPAGDLELSARLRFQNTIRSWVNDPEDKLSRYYTRFRLKALYDIPSCKLNPFTSLETFSPTSTGRGFEISKFRFGAGTEINLPGKTSFDLEWLFEQDSRPDLVNTNIISVTYNLKF